MQNNPDVMRRTTKNQRNHRLAKVTFMDQVHGFKIFVGARKSQPAHAALSRRLAPATRSDGSPRRPGALRLPAPWPLGYRGPSAESWRCTRNLWPSRALLRHSAAARLRPTTTTHCRWHRARKRAPPTWRPCMQHAVTLKAAANLGRSSTRSS